MAYEHREGDRQQQIKPMHKYLIVVIKDTAVRVVYGGIVDDVKYIRRAAQNIFREYCRVFQQKVEKHRVYFAAVFIYPFCKLSRVTVSPAGAVVWICRQQRLRQRLVGPEEINKAVGRVMFFNEIYRAEVFINKIQLRGRDVPAVRDDGEDRLCQVNVGIRVIFVSLGADDFRQQRGAKNENRQRNYGEPAEAFVSVKPRKPCARIYIYTATAINIPANTIIALSRKAHTNPRSTAAMREKCFFSK